MKPNDNFAKKSCHNELIRVDDSKIYSNDDEEGKIKNVRRLCKLKHGDCDEFLI